MLDNKALRKNLPISVAILTRNRHRMLRFALISLVNQTTPATEILIVNNGSIDRTTQVVEEFMAILPIRYMYESRIGIPYARNKALKLAKGKILAFLDDDCEAAPNWLEQIRKMHHLYPDIAIQGLVTPLDRGSLITQATEYLVQGWINANLKSSGEIGIIITMNSSFKLEIINKYKLRFDENLAGYFRGEDTDFAYQLRSKNYKIRYCPEIKIFYKSRANLIGFIKQRFNTGRLTVYMRFKWPSDYFDYESEAKISPLIKEYGLNSYQEIFFRFIIKLAHKTARLGMFWENIFIKKYS